MRRKWAKAALIGAGVILATAGTWWGVSRYREYRFEKKWEQVQVGMTEEEVLAILGEPARRAGASWPYQIWGPRWEVESCRKFPYVRIVHVTDWDWEVYFSEEGTVRKKVR